GILSTRATVHGSRRQRIGPRPCVTARAGFTAPCAVLPDDLPAGYVFRRTGTLRLPRSRMTPRTVSALRIARTWTFGSSDHLSPFAMWTTLPSSDYYGDSVAVGLASRRRSRVPSVLHVSSVT